MTNQTYRVVCRRLSGEHIDQMEVTRKDTRTAAEPALDVDLCPRRWMLPGQHQHILQTFDAMRLEWVFVSENIAAPDPQLE